MIEDEQTKGLIEDKLIMDLTYALSIGSKEDFQHLLDKQTKEVLKKALARLLEKYLNDKNSSTLRELLVLRIRGCQPLKGKLGPNGVQGDIPYEVKPRNVLSGENKKLNGSGNFTDLTDERLAKYLEQGLRVLVAGFVDGNLIYVLELPIRCLESTLKKQLQRLGPRQKGTYLRSGRFSYRNYIECPEVNLVFLRSEWEQYSKFLTRDFHTYLRRLKQLASSVGG